MALDTLTSGYRARLIPQSQLWENGVHLGKLLGKFPEDEGDVIENGNSIETEHTKKQNGHYFGGKWGVYVRAPDLWFQLLDETRGRWSPLGKVANVRYGVLSGKDVFFFPRDNSGECLKEDISPAEFKRKYDVPRRDVDSGKVKLVRCGEEYGEIKPIEAEYLEPEVHGLMEVDEFVGRRALR